MSIQTRTTGLQNEIVRLYCTLEYNGRLVTPIGQPLVEILDADGVTPLAIAPAQEESTGMYYVDWYVPAKLPVGNYYDRWTFQWDPSSEVKEIVLTFVVNKLDSYINFVGNGTVHNISNRALQLMKDLCNEFIFESQHINVFWEQGTRVQQENVGKRVEKYYYLTLDSNDYEVSEDAVYFNNGNRFTVWQTLESLVSSSSSLSSSSESEENFSTSSSLTSSSSSSSMDSSSSSSTSMSSSSSSEVSSSSSESDLNFSSSSSSLPSPTTTTTTTAFVEQQILTCVGTGDPTTSGTLMKVSGTGPDTIGFTSYAAKTSRFSTIYDFAYQNWNKDPKPILRLNQRIVDDGWYVDDNGRVYIDRIIAPEDSVNMRYQFSYFSTEEILSFLSLGLKLMNATPPASEVYNSLNTMPQAWDAPVLLCAAITALKRLIFGLNWQERAIIFTRPDDPNAANQAIANFKDLYQSYNELWMEIRKDVKTKKLPGIAMVIQPE